MHCGINSLLVLLSKKPRFNTVVTNGFITAEPVCGEQNGAKREKLNIVKKDINATQC